MTTGSQNPSMPKDSTIGGADDSPESWVDHYGDDLYRFAFLRVHDRSIAEDLVQEALLAALRGSKGFRRSSSTRTWLIGILSHKIGDHRRGLLRRSGEEPGHHEDGPADDPFDARGRWKRPPRSWRLGPLLTLENREFRAVLHRCLDGLPERCGSAFALRVVEGLAAEEVCEVLGISSSNLWVLLHRARIGMRSCLELKWFGESAKESS